jgi:hypothetical protein
MNLSPHFTLEELAFTSVRGMGPRNLAEAQRFVPALKELAAMLEQVRVLCGDKPVVIHSGFRCPQVNDRINGSSSSQHLKGEAADFHVVGADLTECFDRIRASQVVPFGQLILEDGDGDGVPTWIHISLGAPWRPAAKCRQVLTYDGRTYSRVS